MVDVRQTEPERQKAIQELTALRREFKTETAAGAKAAAKDPRFIAAKERLDTAKSAVGMRTSAQDLAALNKIATSDTATMKKDEQGRMTAAPTRAERAVTKELNQPSKQYLRQVTQAQKQSLTDGTKVPFWKSNNKITPEMIADYANYNADISKARYDWVWVPEEKGDGGRWGLSIIGAVQNKPADISKASKTDIFYSDSASIAESRKISGARAWNVGYGAALNFDEIEQAMPNILFSELQELIYQLTLEKNTDITIEDLLDKYDEMFGEG